MTQSNYKIIFKLEVFHSYFEDNICNCLLFKPTAETLQLLNRFGFTMRNNINGFDFYTNSNTSLSSLLQYVKTATDKSCFEFDIESNNPAFNFFTELPADWMGQLLYDSGSASNHAESGSLILATRLSEKATGSITGRLTIQFDDILKYTGEKQYADFGIRLNARNTQWQYFIINKSSLQLANPFIKGTDNKIEFDLPEKVTIRSGQDAIMFSSGKNFLQLCNKPKYKFSLVDHLPAGETDVVRKSTDKVIFKGLPAPDPARINIININGSRQISSPIYVFI